MLFILDLISEANPISPGSTLFEIYAKNISRQKELTGQRRAKEVSGSGPPSLPHKQVAIGILRYSRGTPLEKQLDLMGPITSRMGPIGPVAPLGRSTWSSLKIIDVRTPPPPPPPSTKEYEYKH